MEFDALVINAGWLICSLTSRHKNDFKHINDMFRLLQYKGYRFPESGNDNFAIPDDSLRTEGELEDEDKIVQGAVFIMIDLIACRNYKSC